MKNPRHFRNALYHLYINPLEKCNLRCKICYTRKTFPILSEQEILAFITSYGKTVDLQTVTFCGGEVFTLPYFTEIINRLTQRGIFVQVITNGSIDRTAEIQRPNFVNLIVSIDGLQPYHDKNRGKGSFNQCIAFLRKAKRLGFHTEIFSIVTQQNLLKINEFEKLIRKIVGNMPITYHPRKPRSYLSKHPLSNITGHVSGFDFLSSGEMVNLMKTKHTFPPKDLGCYQISLASDGMIYGCCEGYDPIGTIKTPPEALIRVLQSKIDATCLGCYQPSFMCGLKEIVATIHA